MEKEVTIVRTANVPIERAWKAWTDPKELMQWWGPDNVTIPECEIDVRVGGKFHIVMEASEAMGPYKGTRWPMEAQFTAVEQPNKLSYSAQAWTEGMPKEDWLIDQTTEVTFTAEGGKTKVQVKAAIHKTGPKAGAAAEGMEYGFTQQLAKLDAFLAAK